MLNLAKAERKAARLVNNLDIDDLYDQIDTLRGYIGGTFLGSRQECQPAVRPRSCYASDTAQDAEEMMKDNLAASLVLAVGLGVLVGYFIRRGSE